MDAASPALGETRAAALDRVASLLEKNGVEEPRRDARALLLAAGEMTAAGDRKSVV